MSQMEEIFGEGGWLSEHLPNYQPRPGQLDLAKAVEGSIHTSAHLLAEGPTGTGKSMAYGIPAAMHALGERKTVVIATANITLQEQLYKKDLPLIRDVIDGQLAPEIPELRFILMKGMANYACLDKLAELEEAGCDESWFHEIADWAHGSATGDKSELPVEYPLNVWGNVSSTSDECTRSQCKYFDECFALASRYDSDDEEWPHIVVTNYHMLYTDMLIREATAGNAQILPNYSVLIMDEAHEAVDIAMSFNGFDLSAGKLRWLTRGVSKIGDDAGKVVASVNTLAGKFFDSLDWGGDIFRKPLGYDNGLVQSLTNAADYIITRVGEENDGSESEAARSRKNRMRQLSTTLKKRAHEIREVAFGDEDGKLPSGKVYYVEKDSKGQSKLCCKTVEVQNFLRQNIFSQKTLVAVSATLATSGSFKFVAGEFGLHRTEYESHISPSPFDPERMLVVVPSTVPIPKKRDQHELEVNRVIKRIVTDLDGRTMALFTSYRALKSAARFLEGKLNGIDVLVQGQLPKSRIIEKFKENENSLILATASFWQGVDIPGRALSCLIIDKFPFMPPSDPVLKYMEEVIEEEGGSSFFDYSVPKAIISLKQGVGRLIRTEDDYGVVVLCDNRLQTTGYGKQFMRAFPDGHFMSEDGDIRDVSGFLREFE